MVAHLLAAFPGLASSAFRVTSPPDGIYNCVAWAAGVTNDWWWPDENPEAVWPAGVPRERTVAAFAAAFATLGYAECPSDQQEEGFEKVAVFANRDGLPMHATWQLANGYWTSKLGRAEDIEHELRALEGDVYGAVVLVMKRALPTTAPA